MTLSPAIKLEVAAGVEPALYGFANRRLTDQPRDLNLVRPPPLRGERTTFLYGDTEQVWRFSRHPSGRRLKRLLHNGYLLPNAEANADTRGRGRSRTCIERFCKPLLSPVSHATIDMICAKKMAVELHTKNGADNRSRTCLFRVEAGRLRPLGHIRKIRKKWS